MPTPVTLGPTPPPPPPRRVRARPIPTPARGTLLLVAAGFALRLGYAWVAQGPDAEPFSDARQIDTVAWNLARGAGFAYGEGAGAYPTAIVPPVVPWVVSLLYRLVGHEYFGAIALQCAVGALAAPLARSLGGALFGPAAGTWAGWLTAVHPLLVFFSAYLLTETFFTTLLLAALLASALWLRTPRPGRAFGTGLLWGAAILTRPTALLLPALVAAWAWIPLGLTVAPRDRWRQIALLAAGALVVIAPWSLRSSLVSGAFVPLKTGAGRTFLDANHEELWRDPARRGGAGSAMEHERYAALIRGRSEVAADSVSSALAWEFLDRRRDEWPAMAAAKIARFWRLSREGGTTGTWQRAGSPLEGLLRRVDPLLLWSVVVLPFAAWGAARALAGPRRWYQAIVPATILLFTLMVIPYWGSLRLRAPVEPLLVMLAGFGFDDLRRRLAPRARGLALVRGTGRAARS